MTDEHDDLAERVRLHADAVAKAARSLLEDHPDEEVRIRLRHETLPKGFKRRLKGKKVTLRIAQGTRSTTKTITLR